MAKKIGDNKKSGEKKGTVDNKIEELAISVGRGFAATATKSDIETVVNEMRAGFAAADQKLERIEYSAAGLSRRVDTVEDRVRQLATKVGLSFS
jgi:hypothetical protein